MPGLWDWIKGIATQNANQYLYASVPSDDPAPVGEIKALTAYQSYFRLWLAEMFLTKQRNWFIDWFPAVHSSVRLKFGNQDGVTLSRVAQPPSGEMAGGVQLNYRLTELLPFNGGVVELEAGLLALKGDNHLKAAIGVLQDFSDLVAAPLGQVLDVAKKVTTGMDKLVGAGESVLHLPFHQSYTASGGGNELKPGYTAVILATSKQIATDRLSVRGGRLYYASVPGLVPTPFQQYDYMLFRIEARAERDDWRLKNIQEPLEKAIDAMVNGHADEADGFRKAAIAAALLSPDLANIDRRRVVQAIKDELKAIGEGAGLGAAGVPVKDLTAIMTQRAMNSAKSANLSELDATDAFAE